MTKHAIGFLFGVLFTALATGMLEANKVSDTPLSSTAIIVAVGVVFGILFIGSGIIGKLSEDR